MAYGLILGKLRVQRLSAVVDGQLHHIRGGRAGNAAFFHAGEVFSRSILGPSANMPVSLFQRLSGSVTMEASGIE